MIFGPPRTESELKKERTRLKRMFASAASVVLAQAILGLDVPNRPSSVTGSWQVDARYSDAKLVTDATTDYGKTKINTTLGFARSTEGSQLTRAIRQNPLSNLGSTRRRLWHLPSMRMENF